jgi:hypothetical protein
LHFAYCKPQGACEGHAQMFSSFLIFASNIHFLFEMLGGSVRKNYVEKLEECAITIEV